MKDSDCKREEELLAAFVTGTLTEPQQEHLVQCATCSSAIETSRLMSVLVNSTEGASTVSTSASVIWGVAMIERERQSRMRFRLIQLALGIGAMLASVIVSVIIWSLRGIEGGLAEKPLSLMFGVDGQSAVAPFVALVALSVAVALLVRIVNLSSRASNSA